MAKETQEQRAIAKAVTEEEVRLRIAQKQFAEQLSEGIYAGDNKLGLVDDKVLIDAIASFIEELRQRKLDELGLLGEDGKE
jgi:hypothetical protein